MAVALRLKQMGTKNRPFFRIVAVDSRKARDGRSLANLGHYSPTAQPAVVNLDEERALSFLKTGAQPTAAVADLLKQKGIMRKPQGEWAKNA